MQHEIRQLDRHGVETAVDWARHEGWNPGLADAAAFRFAAADFSGVYVEGKLAATISLVRYGAYFAFLGFYICAPEFRQKGLGWALWSRVLDETSATCIGLDGVKAQQPNYAKSGFTFAHGNLRYGGPKPHIPLPANDRIGPIGASEAAAFEAGHQVFPAARSAFLESWLGTDGHVALGFRTGGMLRGYGVSRPCHDGYKIGPLFAETPDIAQQILVSLIARIQAPSIFLDVPAINHDAVALAVSLSLEPRFETARMYRGPAPHLDHAKIFGITSFELG